MSSLGLNSYNHSFKFLVNSYRSFLPRPTFTGLVIFGEDFTFVFVSGLGLAYLELVGNECEPGADNLRTANLSSLRARGTIEA